jgi:hypothetical protein
MSVSRWIVAACLALPILACAADVVEVPKIERLESLELQRTICFGMCPEYTVAVGADRRVRFSGGRFVSVESAEREVRDAEIEALVAALNEAGFLRLQDRYETQEDGCAVATDSPTVVLSVVFDGVSKSVRHYHGCLTPRPKPEWRPMTPPDSPLRPPPAPVLDPPCPFPMALVQLQNRIDAILRTESWVGRAPYGYPHCTRE